MCLCGEQCCESLFRIYRDCPEFPHDLATYIATKTFIYDPEELPRLCKVPYGQMYRDVCNRVALTHRYNSAFLACIFLSIFFSFSQKRERKRLQRDFYYILVNDLRVFE